MLVEDITSNVYTGTAKYGCDSVGYGLCQFGSLLVSTAFVYALIILPDLSE